MLTLTKTRPNDLLEIKKGPISSINAFRTLPRNLLPELAKHQIDKWHAKGDSIFLEDDSADFIWFVVKGHVKETNYLPNGRSVTLSRVGANGMFGVSALDGGQYGCHCLAETDAAVTSFPILVFRSLMGKYPDIAQAVASDIAKLLRHSRDIRMLSHETAEKRIVHVLMEMAGDFDNTIPLTRREIASMAGTSTETCIRVIARFKHDRLLSSGHGKIIVHNTENLRDRMNRV